MRKALLGLLSILLIGGAIASNRCRKEDLETRAAHTSVAKDAEKQEKLIRSMLLFGSHTPEDVEHVLRIIDDGYDGVPFTNFFAEGAFSEGEVTAINDRLKNLAYDYQSNALEKIRKGNKHYERKIYEIFGRNDNTESFAKIFIKCAKKGTLPQLFEAHSPEELEKSERLRKAYVKSLQEYNRNTSDLGLMEDFMDTLAAYGKSRDPVMARNVEEITVSQEGGEACNLFYMGAAHFDVGNQVKDSSKRVYRVEAMPIRGDYPILGRALIKKAKDSSYRLSNKEKRDVLRDLRD